MSLITINFMAKLSNISHYFTIEHLHSHKGKFPTGVKALNLNQCQLNSIKIQNCFHVTQMIQNAVELFFSVRHNNCAISASSYLTPRWSNLNVSHC